MIVIKLDSGASLVILDTFIRAEESVLISRVVKYIHVCCSKECPAFYRDDTDLGVSGLERFHLTVRTVEKFKFVPCT